MPNKPFSLQLLKTQQRMLKLRPRQLSPLIRLRHSITSLVKTSPSPAFSRTIKTRLTLLSRLGSLIDHSNLVYVPKSDASLCHNGSEIPLRSCGGDLINAIVLIVLVNSERLDYIFVRSIKEVLHVIVLGDQSTE